MSRKICYLMLSAVLTVLFISPLAGPVHAHDINMHKLPLGDGKISHGPKAGWIWACHVDPQAGGA